MRLTVSVISNYNIEGEECNAPAIQPREGAPSGYSEEKPHLPEVELQEQHSFYSKRVWKTYVF